MLNRKKCSLKSIVKQCCLKNVEKNALSTNKQTKNRCWNDEKKYEKLSTLIEWMTKK